MKNTHHGGYPCEPRSIDDFSWFYEEPRGVDIYHYSEGKTVSIKIPWGKLRRAVDNHRKVKAGKKYGR